MAITMNNHVFKGHKTLLGNKYVTYGEVELPTRYEIYEASKNGFDWGYMGSATKQLAFSILYQLSDEQTAKDNTLKFATDVIKHLNNRDWILSASEVLQWLDENTQKTKKDEETKEEPSNQQAILETKEEIITPKAVKKPTTKKSKKSKNNVVKDICTKLNITQKQLAEILEVPEGTISSWAVKDEIPRLGKKAIEFYMQNQKNQKIVNSYKDFLNLMKSA